MPRFVSIDATRCRYHGWQRFSRYDFAAGDWLVPVVADEIPHVLATLPLAFRFNAGPGTYELVALMSFQQGMNLLVHPDGRWMGGYIPAVYRCYPFWSLPEKDTGRMVLCFDMDSGLYRDSPGPEDTSFFDAKGEMSPLLSNTAQFLQKLENQRRITGHITAVLDQQALIVPWEIKVQDENRNPLPVEGLYRIDEEALKGLPVEKLDNLRKAVAFPLAYAQLFSQHRLSNLFKLYNVHYKIKQNTPDVDLDSLFGQDDAFQFDS